jgi:hypothetical protein
MDRDAARRRADRVRSERGWSSPTPEPPAPPRRRTPLRIVRTETG